MKITPRFSRRAAVLAALLISCVHLQAQTSPAPTTTLDDDEVVVLSPFEVSASSETDGYTAATTLAGNRLNTELRDIGSAVTVITSQFLKDTGAVNNASLLQYAPNSEVGGVFGNFAGTGDGAQLNEPIQRPNENTRIRGLAAADSTRDFFRTEIPWDSYNIDRVDLQRGPNSILFGQGSPAGIINAGTKSASFRNSGEFEARFGSYGTTRATLDLNQVLVKDQVAVRLDALFNDEKFKQDPAFSRDQRLSGAIRIEPAFLKKNGARTIFKANFENGEIDSNNPRSLPLTDNITPWFGTGAAGVHQGTYVGWGMWDHLSGRINHGQARAPSDSVYSSPWLRAGFGTSGGREPVAFFGSSSAPTFWITDVRAELQSNGIGPNGAIDSDIGGFSVAPGSMRGIAGTSAWAVNAGIPFSAAGIHKDNHLTDPSIFDFYNNLIDGDTKREWQRFNSSTLNLVQTFLDDQAGFSLDYNKENYQSGQVALLGGNVGLHIDPMAVFADGTPDAGLTGVPFGDGTPNPNAGRPFVSSTGGFNNSFSSDREVKRATAFITHDFGKTEKTWLNRIVGAHTLTGMLAEDEQATDSRVWQRYGYLEDSVYAIEHLDPRTNTFAQMTPTSIVYLAPSLKGKSIVGAGIPGVMGNPTITSGQIRFFDDHWKHTLDPTSSGYVDPAAAWINNAYTTDPSKLVPGTVPPLGRLNSTQSENPAHYVGWRSAPLNVTDSEAGLGNRDLLTTNASLKKSITTSQALVWQGKMLDNSIVGTYGWRKDINKSWSSDRRLSTVAGNRDYKHIDFDDYELPSSPNGRTEVQSRAYSVVAHLMDVPGIKDWTKDLPFEISLSYNQSTNFKPDSSRVDILGERIASPSGKTIDRGITIATRDGKYSLRVNRYITSNKDASGTNSGGFGYGLGEFMGYASIWTNIFQYDIGNGFHDNQTAGYFQTGPRQRYDFHTAGTEQVNAETMADEAAAIAGMRAFQAKVDPRFWSAWGFTSLAHVQSGAPIPIAMNGDVRVPSGFTVTEDSVSKGWEIELSAQPTRNWRIAMNASKSEAVRTNIGGENLINLMSLISTEMQGDAGKLHYWWGTADVPRAQRILYTELQKTGVEWASRKLLEGTNVPELREWRFNAISNYDITTGFLKGVNFGGGVRYQSDVSIGYPPTGSPTDPGSLGFDLSNPYKGPSETNFDFWIGYSRKLTRKIDWHIQLNVRNAFNDDDLIPITAQGPIPGQAAGTPAGYRIAPTQTFLVTNTFNF